MSNDLNKDVRKFIYDHLFSFAIPPTLEKIMIKFKKDREEIIKALVSLHNDHLIVFDQKINKIMIAHPFSGIPTSFVVKSSQDRKYYATCAWDSIALHFTLEDDIEVESYCHYCNNEIRLILSNNQIVLNIPEETTIHFQEHAGKWWDDIIDTCFNTMNYFCSKEHLEKWIQKNPSKAGEEIPDDKILDLSQFLYKNKMNLEYVRPSVEQTKEKFSKIGLVGEFWKI